MSRERLPSRPGGYAMVSVDRLSRERLPSQPETGTGLYPRSSDPSELERTCVEQARAIEAIGGSMATKEDVRAVESKVINLAQQFALEHTRIRSTVATIVAVATVLGVLLQAALKFL